MVSFKSLYVKSSKSFRLSDYEYKILYKDKSWHLKAQSDHFDVALIVEKSVYGLTPTDKNV